MHITSAGLTFGATALCAIFLASCAPRPAIQYSAPPQGSDEQAAAQAFEALVGAYVRQDWHDVMALIADDVQIEPAVPDAAGASGADAPRVMNKHEYGEAIKPLMASLRGYQVEQVTLRTVDPAHVLVSATVTVLMADQPSIQQRDRFWVFEHRGEHWLVVRAQYL